MKRFLPLAAVLAAFAASPAFSQAEAVEEAPTGAEAEAGMGTAGTATTVTPADLTAEQFVNTATVSNAFEIATSELALERATREDVRAFAQQMITEHNGATERLTAAAQADDTPAPAPYLDARHQEMVAVLTDATAESFDQAYLEMQLNAHIESIALFNAYAGREGELGAFAAELLPSLRMHEEMVRGLIGG